MQVYQLNYPFSALAFTFVLVAHSVKTSTAADSYGIVRTLAGLVSGDADGTGTSAFFNEPKGLAVNSKDTYLYVADSQNHKIRRIRLSASHSGTNHTDACLAGTLQEYPETTFGQCETHCGEDLACAGFSFGSSANSTCIISTLNSCNSGTTCDLTTNEWCFYSRAPTVGTLAGAGSPGFLDAAGTVALFSTPYDLTLSSDNIKLYVADFANHMIRMIDCSTRAVTTVAGGGSRGAFFDERDGTGTAAGQPLIAPCHFLTRASTSHPVVIIKAMPGSAGSLCVCQAEDQGRGAGFNNPAGIALSSDDAELYVADSGNHKIRKVTLATSIVTTIVGGGASGAALGFTHDGTGTSVRICLKGRAPGRRTVLPRHELDEMLLTSPTGLTVSADGASIFISSIQTNHIFKAELATGVASVYAGDGNPGRWDATGEEAQFHAPAHMARSSSDASAFFVADRDNMLIRRVGLAQGEVSTTCGGASIYGSTADGTGTAAGLSLPFSMAVGENGKMYVADGGNHRIRGVTVITTFHPPPPHLIVEQPLDLLAQSLTLSYSQRQLGADTLAQDDRRDKYEVRLTGFHQERPVHI
ncbi:hypothetical protein CYMTET_6760 [Cymbomonas tetramitiformis]|uniref:NHL repeat-containing protein n=1 Tax=Cymbomonas tetramitiformis TaxID=36881 RepID=A0AAE0GWZ1_9CHLO|nr:hypothetical protein CYMTET_6760 [Cymbomonas tetramitiformis]